MEILMRNPRQITTNFSGTRFFLADLKQLTNQKGFLKGDIGKYRSLVPLRLESA